MERSPPGRAQGVGKPPVAIKMCGAVASIERCGACGGRGGDDSTSTVLLSMKRAKPVTWVKLGTGSLALPHALNASFISAGCVRH